MRATVVVELYRLRCPDCGLKTEKVPQLPSKAPFSKRFEEDVGLACESAAVRRVARQFGLAASTVRAIDVRYLQRWAATRRKPALRQMGVDELHLGKKQKFLTVVTNLETGEPLWFGRERKNRFVCEGFGSDARADAGNELFPYLKNHNEARQCDDLEELSNLFEFLANAEFPKPSGERIAVIGSGPAGLAAVHDLALMGFRPTIFETEPHPAGMLYTGVPGYRLPRELIRAEVAVIQSLGVEIRCNTQVGKDVSFTDLRREFSAVIIACGAKRKRALPIPNVDAIGVMGGVDFLRDVSLDKQVELGQRVIVIGGGNVAYDVARTVLRQEEYDVSRTAARMAGVRQVNLACLESLEEMPADTVEILEGQEEGVTRLNSWGPKEVLVYEKEGQKFVRGVKFVRCIQVYDENKRFAPKFDESVTTEIEGDTILLSVGQSADVSFLDAQRDGIEMRSPQQIVTILRPVRLPRPMCSSPATSPTGRG